MKKTTLGYLNIRELNNGENQHLRLIVDHFG